MARCATAIPALDPVRTGHELMRRQITSMVEDVIADSQRPSLPRLQPQSADDVRGAGATIVDLLRASWPAREKELKAFLFKQHLSRTPRSCGCAPMPTRSSRDLFDAYFADPREMPEGWREGLDRADDAHQGARMSRDFLAGMTDTYAIKEHRRLFDHTPDLR